MPVPTGVTWGGPVPPRRQKTLIPKRRDRAKPRLVDERLLLVKGDEAQVVIKALPKEDRASILAGLDFNGNVKAPIFYHEFNRLENRANIRAAHEDAEEGDVQQLVGVGINIPQLPKAADGCLYIIFIPTEDGPVSQVNPDLVAEIAPVALPDFHPVGEVERETFKAKRAPADGRFTHSAAGEEDRLCRGEERGHFECRAGTPKPGSQAASEDLIEVIRGRVRDFNSSSTARDMLLPGLNRVAWEEDRRSGRPRAGRPRNRDLAVRERGRGAARAVHRSRRRRRARGEMALTVRSSVTKSHAEEAALQLPTAGRQVAPLEAPKATTSQGGVTERDGREEEDADGVGGQAWI